MVLTLACAAALLFALDEARAAEPEGACARRAKAGAADKLRRRTAKPRKSEEGEAGKAGEGEPDDRPKTAPKDRPEATEVPCRSPSSPRTAS